MRWIQLFIVLILGNLPLQSQAIALNYAYLDSNEQGYTLWFVDPNTLETRAYPFSNTESGLMSASSSPNGAYILFWFNDRGPYPRPRLAEDPSFLRLLDVRTGELHDLARLPYIDGFLEQSSVPLWSPNSRYITHLATVYDVITGESFALSGSPIAFGWSADSTRLAVGERRCRDNGCYGISVSILQLSDMTVTQAATYDEWWDICNLTWSPNQTTIAFETKCSYWFSGLYGYGELMLWDLPTNSIAAITDYTIAPDEYYAQYGMVRDGSVDYSVLWIDEDSLLGSVYHWDEQRSIDDTGQVPDPETFVVETFLYDVDDNRQTRLNSEWVDTWAQNPITPQIAYQIVQIELTESVPGITTQTRAEIVVLEDDTLHVQQTLPSGCHLAWSPDGQWLAFTETESDFNWYRCGSPQSLFFAASDGSTALRTSPLPLDTEVIGWVQAPQSDAFNFPNGTPTPIPTVEFIGAG